MRKFIKLKPMKRLPKLTAKEKEWIESTTMISAEGDMTFNPRHYSMVIHKDGWFTAKRRSKKNK